MSNTKKLQLIDIIKQHQIITKHRIQIQKDFIVKVKNLVCKMVIT